MSAVSPSPLGPGAASPLPPAPLNPALTPPPRRAGSIRRTSSMLMSWQGGLTSAPVADLRLEGRARDLLTPSSNEPGVGGPSAGEPSADTQPRIVAEARLLALTGRQRDITEIEAEPAPEGLERLVGCRAGGNLRSSIVSEMPQEVEAGTPLHLLLDDLAGATLIAGFAWYRWAEHVPEFKERLSKAPRPKMVGICSGFREGSSALHADGTLKGISENVAVAPPLADPADPFSWHELGDHPEMAMRRARRIDVWVEDGRLEVDAMFRDSCWEPDGSEIIVHEYQLLAQADAATGVLLSVLAQPRVLPYPECPVIAPNATLLNGTPMRSLRAEVLDRLRTTDCCTHLNDGLRALAEVPILASALAQGRSSAPLGPLPSISAGGSPGVAPD
jgi:Protein of unknown function (DUF2889)